MQKIIITLLFISILIFQPLFASADEYDRNEAFVSWKLMAYSLYPFGYTLEKLIVKPGHWLFSLPFLKDISGHEELSKSLVSMDSEDNFESYEKLKSLYLETKSQTEKPEKVAQNAENLASAEEAITDNAKKFAARARTSAARAENSASQSEDAAIKAEEAAGKAELSAQKAEAVFNKLLQK
ncbi:MAG: hypothetical protein A2043_00450 [Candidatus Schekmanbacteria bacterium GWA2_38_9]|uniref:Uncharacterized protein n=1 Tax=Candidatus Schekmanbacteria bacterium RIFCSPLOWO2_12_FULL_38_15 TaxID=1817883 RepID=A0A1F7SHX1_9BACT|nr:MAG: hypothetical protein A2043_00450 [Candidatus Schekmanbacteria bacterium GWA2_38_9]OGL50885.1 MAG: hypothetical protein A3H37_03490 [Candidatus Schekmanbacteria bacterium RIFCSPLOWO2_02_FULL_38_14]OGL53355.1 MAG: hypothetical protein A3G31_07575 [Candidatus Schekmanbacteria bacterium RIFCSPLOWO2_12_FULL_38_15]